MRFNSLDDWLSWQESLNPAEIDLGLERIASVLSQAGLANTFSCPLITVAGTNGKGSVVAILESIAIAAGLKVCSYTSPHLFRYNERIKINRQAIDDTSLCEAFERIDQARGEAELTYFEFGTLAAIDVFHHQQADLVILEVGLGGRLDAVNIMDSDISILTSVAIDHVDWLGDNREAIGYEKAGVFRANKPVICGDIKPPKSVLQHAKENACELFLLGRDYAVLDDENDNNKWILQSDFHTIKDLPLPSLFGSFQKSNVATALVAFQSLYKQGLLPDSVDLYNDELLSQGLRKIELLGRFQQLQQSPAVFVDVAHNPAAAISLASQLQLSDTKQGKTWAIVAMLADKDVAAVIDEVASEVDCWCFAGLEDVARGLAVFDLVDSLSQGQLVAINGDVLPLTKPQIQHDLSENQCTILSDRLLLTNTVEQACELVLAKANKKDRIIIFGSFYTVAEAMQFFTSETMGLNH